MPSVLRRVLVVVAGAVVAVAVVSTMDGAVGRVYPMPAGTDMSDPEAMRAAIAAMPLSALILLVVGWALAAAVGAFVAVRLSADRWRPAGYIVGGLLLLATIANLLMIPHPIWMWPAALILIPLAAWGAVRLAARTVRAS